MGSTVRFSRDDLLELRQLRQRAVAAAELPDVCPWGWSLDLVDAAAIVAAFPMFDTLPGQSWTTYHHRGEEGLCGVLVTRFEDAKPWPIPPESRPDVMSALTTERSAWNLLCASILRRELEELGGKGGYRKWGKHDLISTNPWDLLSEEQRTANHRHFTEGQYWMEEMLEDLSPRVEETSRGAKVTFYTARREYHMPVYVHQDEYGEEGLATEPGRRLVGRVPYKKPAWAGNVEDPRL